MSRIGKKLITIPEKTEVSVSSGKLAVRGPLGAIERSFPDQLNFLLESGVASIKPKRETRDLVALQGTFVSHLENMVLGVNKGFEKKLVIEGVGYRAAVSGSKLTLNLGFSHPVEVVIPEGLKVTVEKNVLTVSGYDKEVVGQFTAQVRALKKPEPYKGKGIRYSDEVVRRKEGKKVAS